MVRRWMHHLYSLLWKLSTATAIGWTIPCGPTEIDEHITQRYSSWLKKIPLHRSMEFGTISLHFLHKTDVNMLYRLFGDTNICTYISLYVRNTAISVKKRFVCISLHQLVNTCDLHLELYIVIPCGFKQEISLVEDLVSTTATSKHQRFTLNIHSFKLLKRS